MIFSPANNTEFSTLQLPWKHFGDTSGRPFAITTSHSSRTGQYQNGGLKEFIDHVISAIGRVQIKPATECLRGVATYPSGDQRQGRYKMTLTDLVNHHYDRAVREGTMDLTLGRSDHALIMKSK